MLPFVSLSQVHPSLLITHDNLPQLREGVHHYPLLKSSYQEIKLFVDNDLKSGKIDVPAPRDAGGGFTHEQHKKNYQLMLNSAICYQVSQDKKYFDFTKRILEEYAGKYNTWPEHPKRVPGHPAGRIFWQNLNDCVWLVNTIQAYDLILPELSAGDKRNIEENLFTPMVHYLMVTHRDVFDKIHNHGTWSDAAVGITGLVLHNQKWADKAIYGSNLDKQTGFLKQLDSLFSPDGYYAEGPYYQRYALLPFVLFAKAINNYRPEFKIFEYRNQILSKAVEVVFQLSYTNGLLFPFNDAIKDKSVGSSELILADNVIYSDVNADPGLLGMALKQGKVTVSDAGVKVSKDIFEGKAEHFNFKTILIHDGVSDERGGVGIIRNGTENSHQTLVLKNTTQGMGHGHFDRLNFLLYDNGGEIFADYGAARFLNIESKSGGHYLKENNSWAKQTIAHNTIVINETSQFDGKVDDAEKQYPTDIALSDHDILKYTFASDHKAYPGVRVSRALITLKLQGLQNPVIVDVNTVFGNQEIRTIDLPYYYAGQVVDEGNNSIAAANTLKTFGTKNGYQYLWFDGNYGIQKSGDYITLLINYKFYKIHFASTNPGVILNHVHLGANDPYHNLIPTRGIILRQQNTNKAVFAQVIESYGKINPTDETITNAESVISDFKVNLIDNQKIQLDITTADRKYLVMLEIRDDKISGIKSY